MRQSLTGFIRFVAALPAVWVLAALLGLPALAQQSGPVEIVPMTKEFVPYFHAEENGIGKQCGVTLYGSFPVYKNITNLSSYKIFIPGVQNPSAFAARTVAPGGRFRFACCSVGVATPFNDGPCPDESGLVGLPDWHAEYLRQPPRASFTAKEDASDAGLWDFQSTSTDPEDQPLTEKWNFGDGGTGGGLGEIYRYNKPGIFSAKLTVTDSDGQTSQASRTIVVAAPKPVVSVRLFSKHSRNRIELGEEFGVRVTVQATKEGVGALSDLAFTGPALSVPEIFTVVSSPSETPIGTLQPDGQREFNWTLRADKAGQFALTAASVVGKDAAGRSVSGAGNTARGQVTSLIVEVTQNPPKLVLGGDNNGDGQTNALDRKLEIIVSVANVSKEDVTEVKSVILNDPIQLTSLAQNLNIWLTPLDVPPGDFATIRPGVENTVWKTNVYEATDRTYAQASILLQGKAGEAGVQERGEGIVNVGGETLLEARFDVEDRPYKSGQPVRIFGSLKNVSKFRDNRGVVLDEGKTVGVVVYPTIEGNGAVGYVFPKDFGGRTAEGPTSFLLAPDETLDIAGVVATAEVTENSSFTLSYRVEGYIHGEDPQPRRAKPTDIEVVEDSEKGWSASHEVKLAGVPATSDPWLECSTDLSFLGYTSCTLVDGLLNLGGSLKDLTWLTGSGVKEIGVGFYRIAAFDLWVFGQALEGLDDPAALSRLAQELIIDLKALKTVGVESLQAVELSAEALGPSIHRSIQNTKSNLVAGNFKVVAGDLSRFIGENPDLALEALVAVRSVRKVLLLHEGAESAAKAGIRESFERQTAQLAGDVEEFAARNSLADLPQSSVLPVGINVLQHPRIYRDAYGALREEVDAFLRIAKEEGVILAFRARSPKAADYIEALTHLLKPHGVSIKTVSELDIKYLGYPKRFEAECVLVSPPIPWVHPLDPHYQNVIEAYLNRFLDLNGSDDASKYLRAQVEERLKFQLEEWPKQLGNFKKYGREGIDVNFKAYKQFEEGSLKGKLSEQLLPDGKKNFRAAKREVYEFKDAYSGETRRAYRLLMEDGPGSGIFKAITGDLDFMAILNLDGSLPGVFKRIRIYKMLISEGLQHGESFSFFMKDLREGWLRCCTPAIRGGEGQRMLAATPSGQLLTTQFVDDLSIIEGGANNALKVGDGEFAFFAGTLTEVYSAERLGSETIPAALRREAVPYVSVSALARMADELDAEVDRDGGVPIRMGPDGEPEIYGAAPKEGFPRLRSPIAHRAIARQGRPARANESDDPLDAEFAVLAAQGWVAEREVSPPGSAGGQWRPATVTEVRPGVPGSGLKIAPYTYITDDLPAGSSELPVLGRKDLGLAPGSPFFAVGDQVVMDPGGPAEEFATLVSVHPFTLNRPLENLQEVGTTILFLSGIKNTAQLPGALPAQENLLVWLRADAGLKLTGSNVVSWTDQSRHGFVFTSPAAAGSQPLWVSNVVNGLPSLRFKAYAALLSGNLGLTLSNSTIFTLCRFNGEGGVTYPYMIGTRGLSGRQMTLARLGGNGAYHFDGAAGRNAVNTIPGPNFRVFSQIYAGKGPDHHQLNVNLKTVLDTRTTTGRAYSAVATNVFIGNYPTIGSFDGDLVEWLVYDRVLSVQERLEVEEYLRQRAGLAPFFAPGSLALDNWQVSGYDQSPAPEAQWNLDQADRAVVQPLASDPSLLLSPFTAAGDQVIRARLSATNSPGFMGFVFAYRDPGHFYLLDWQQAASTHPEFGTAPPGLRLRAIHIPDGTAPTGTDLWSSPDPSRVTTLRTHNAPWVADREYELVLKLQTGRIELSILDGATELVSWNVEDDTSAAGQFGYYVNGLAGGRFGQVTLPGAAPVITGLQPDALGNVTLDWIGGVAPYFIETRANVGDGGWIEAAPATFNQSQVLTPSAGSSFFRLRSLGVTP